MQSMLRIQLSPEFKFELAHIILSCLTEKVNNLDFYKVDLKENKIYTNFANIPNNPFIVPLDSLIDYDELPLIDMFELKHYQIHYIMGACLVDIVFINFPQINLEKN